MKYALPLILLTLSLIGSAEAAESRRAEVYHCGPQGRDLRDSPCPEAPGKAASSIAYYEPDAAEQNAARDRADADADQATSMERRRQANEAQARRYTSRATNLSAAPVSADDEPQIAHPKKPKPLKPVKIPKPVKPPRPSKAASAPR